MSSCLYEAVGAKETGERTVTTQNATNLGYPVELSSVKLQVRVPLQVLVQRNILLWVPNAVSTSLRLLRIFLEHLIDTLNSVHAIGYANY